MKYYFISYIWRTRGSSTMPDWQRDELITRQHPLAWLTHSQKEDQVTEHHIIFWSEIDQQTAKMYGDQLE